jgi:hypothetical protein
MVSAGFFRVATQTLSATLYALRGLGVAAIDIDFGRTDTENQLPKCDGFQLRVIARL